MPGTPSSSGRTVSESPSVSLPSTNATRGGNGALVGWVIRWIGLSMRPVVHLNRVL
jgi:hypothetical protein